MDPKPPPGDRRIIKRPSIVARGGRAAVNNRECLRQWVAVPQSRAKRIIQGRGPRGVFRQWVAFPQSRAKRIIQGLERGKLAEAGSTLATALSADVATGIDCSLDAAQLSQALRRDVQASSWWQLRYPALPWNGTAGTSLPHQRRRHHSRSTSGGGGITAAPTSSGGGITAAPARRRQLVYFTFASHASVQLRWFIRRLEK